MQIERHYDVISRDVFTGPVGDEAIAALEADKQEALAKVDAEVVRQLETLRKGDTGAPGAGSRSRYDPATDRIIQD